MQPTPVLRAPWRLAIASPASAIGASAGSLPLPSDAASAAAWIGAGLRRTSDAATRALAAIGAIGFAPDAPVARTFTLGMGALVLAPPDHALCATCVDEHRRDLAAPEAASVLSLAPAFADARVTSPMLLVEDEHAARLLPFGTHPRCPICSGVGSGAASLVDPRRGPIRGLARVGDRATRAFGVVDHDDGSSRLAIGDGDGDSRSEAFANAIAETIRRVGCLTATPDIQDRATAELCGVSHVDPARMGLFTDAQYALGAAGFPAHDAKTPLPWQQATCLEDGRPFLTLHDTGLRPAPLYRGTTAGWAAGADRDSAIADALLELVERDALLTSWYRSLRGATEIVVPGARLPGAFDVRLFDVRQDIDVPVVLAVATATRGSLLPEGATFVASAARCTVVQAVSASLHELRRMLPRLHGERPQPSADELREPADHVAYYLHPPNAERLRSWLAEPRPSHRLRRCLTNRPIPSSARGRRWIQSRLALRGYDAYIVDATTARTRSAGLTIVRAVVPDLMPLAWGPPRSMRIGNLARRLARAGAADACPTPLDHDPHPLD